MKAKRAVFRIDGIEGTFKGWTFGEHWNGWACPCFEKEEADRLIKGLQEQPQWKGTAYYARQCDSYIVIEADDADGGHTWEGADILTEEGSRHIYAIGSSFWCWEYEFWPAEELLEVTNLS